MLTEQKGFFVISQNKLHKQTWESYSEIQSSQNYDVSVEAIDHLKEASLCTTIYFTEPRFQFKGA